MTRTNTAPWDYDRRITERQYVICAHCGKQTTLACDENSPLPVLFWKCPDHGRCRTIKCNRSELAAWRKEIAAAYVYAKINTRDRFPLRATLALWVGDALDGAVIKIKAQTARMGFSTIEYAADNALNAIRRCQPDMGFFLDRLDQEVAKAVQG